MSRARKYEAENPGMWAGFAALVTMIVCMLLVAVPRPLGPVPMPLLPLMAVYFWTTMRPSLMPAPAIFLAGLVMDVLTGTPFGFWPLGLLAASGTARALRPFVLGADIGRRLAGMTAVTATATLAAIIALGVSGGGIPISLLQLVQLVLTVLTYPLLEAVLFLLSGAAGLSRGRS